MEEMAKKYQILDARFYLLKNGESCNVSDNIRNIYDLLFEGYQDLEQIKNVD
jgi:hypothetical protein